MAVTAPCVLACVVVVVVVAVLLCGGAEVQAMTPTVMSALKAVTQELDLTEGVAGAEPDKPHVAPRFNATIVNILNGYATGTGPYFYDLPGNVSCCDLACSHHPPLWLHFIVVF